MLSLCVFVPPKDDSEIVLTTSEIVIGEPKSYKHRRLPLTNDIRDVLNKIRSLGLKSHDDFIFVDEDGKRFTAHTIGCAIDRRATEAGIKKTSVHGVRKTVSSILNTMLSQKDVASLLGHSERVNERHYNYSIAEDAEKERVLALMSSKVINFPNALEHKKIAESL